MDTSRASANLYAPPASPAAPEDKPVRFSFTRFLATSAACGLAYPFAVIFLLKTPLWLTAALIVCGVAFPVLWILRPQLSAYGFRGVSSGKFLIVSAGFTVSTLVGFMVALQLLFAAWPFLGLPPLPSD